MWAVKDHSSCYNVTELKVFSKEVIFMSMVYHFAKSFFCEQGNSYRVYIFLETMTIQTYLRKGITFSNYILILLHESLKTYSKTGISLGLRDISAMKFSKDWNPVYELLTVKLATLNYERISMFSKIWHDTISYGFCNKK